VTVAERRRGLRFGSRIVLLLLGLVLASQAATFGFMRFASERSVREQLARELDVGQRVWDRFQANRSRELLDRVAVLAEDFGFREAVTSGDQPTMQSALVNASARLDASVAVLLDADGRPLVDILPDDASFDSAALDALILESSHAGQAAGVLSVGEQPYLVALVPVFAPRLVAWVGMGREFGAADAREFSEITGLQVAVLTLDGTGAPRLLGIDPSPTAAVRALAGDGEVGLDVHSEAFAQDVRLVDDHPAQPSARALRVSMEGAAAVFLLLEASRSAATAPFADLGRQVLLLSLGVAAVALIIAMLVGRQVSRPVEILAQAAQRMRGGDYSAPVAIRTGGELGQLAAAFNQMRAGIAEREATIRHQAGHDRLTGLPNREFALDHLTERLQQATTAPGALLSLDLAGFTEINDTLGHALGDQALVEAGRRLSTTVRPGDLVARLGGDKFLLVLGGVDVESAGRRAGLLVEVLRQVLDIGQTSLQLRCRIGISVFPIHGKEADVLLRRAEIALHDAKAARLSVVAYADGRDEAHLRQLRLVSDLRRCVERGELAVFYQPKVSLADGRVEHAEALLRWRHPELGAIPPDEFIPLAERAGLIHGLTLHVLDVAIGAVSDWQRQGIESGVAINLSAEDLRSEGLPERVQRCLRTHSVSPAKLILEVTESAVMRDLDVALRCLQALRRMGIRIAIDDFGTGQSSLAQLKRLPVDELKIDKGFVLSLAPGGEDELIVRSIIDLAHTLSMRVVAEGVETEVGLGLLRQHGCEVAQGYHFSRPLPLPEFVTWVRQHAKATMT